MGDSGQRWTEDFEDDKTQKLIESKRLLLQLVPPNIVADANEEFTYDLMHPTLLDGTPLTEIKPHEPLALFLKSGSRYRRSRGEWRRQGSRRTRARNPRTQPGRKRTKIEEQIDPMSYIGIIRELPQEHLLYLLDQTSDHLERISIRYSKRVSDKIKLCETYLIPLLKKKNPERETQSTDPDDNSELDRSPPPIPDFHPSYE